MRKLLFIVPLALAGCGGSDGAPPITPPGNGAEVFTPGNVFSPFNTTISLGGTVTFVISGNAHNVIFAATPAGAPANINVVSNTSVARTFNTRGTFPYDCTVHPGMSGQVVVQ
jgi:plastocyanin